MATADKNKKIILYIENDLAQQELIRSILKSRSDITLICVPRAQAGIEVACNQSPDLILSDINLPDMNGFEALNYFKTHQKTQDIPVIALSGNAMPHEVEKGLNAGFVQYLTKPFDISKFLEAVDSVLS